MERTPNDIEQAYRTVFSTNEGKIVLMDLMNAHCMSSSTMDETGRDMVMYREGGRNAVLRILDLSGKRLMAI